ncbi:MAG: nucleotide exchange factor GrpE [Candidatus Poseidoniales archaeon]
MSIKSKNGSKEEDEGQSADLTPEQEIEQLKAEIEETNEKFLRAVADFDNFRKRLDRDKEQQVLRTKGEAFSLFLEIIDTMETAVNYEYPDLKSSIDGMKEIQKMVTSFMSNMKVERFNPINEQFDFRLHEALTSIESDKVKPNIIVDVIQSGYLLEGELLRPAKVVVSKEAEKVNKKEKGE